MREFLLVALGGALGASSRFGVNLIAPWSGAGVPWATLLVNVVGGAAMGALFAFAADNRPLMLLLGVGVLGGFTTFSAFTLDVVLLWQRGEMTKALLYILASVGLSVLAFVAGMQLVKALTHG